MYQAFWNAALGGGPLLTVPFTKLGNKNIALKHGATIKVPKTYQGNFLPHRVLNLSQTSPATGVENAFPNWPESMQRPAVLPDKPTMLIRYQLKYVNPMPSVKSLKQ